MSVRTKTERRGKLQIYFDILRLADEELKSNSSISPTRVAHRANLPYDRFRTCLENLDRIGIIDRDDKGGLLLTRKGLEFAEECKRIEDFLRHMGLWS